MNPLPIPEHNAIEIFELKNRVQHLSCILKQTQLDAAVLFDPANIRYFTDFRMNSACESILTIQSDGSIIYLVAPLDYKRALCDCWIENIGLFPEDDPNYLNPLKKLFSSKHINKLGIEEDRLSYKKMRYLHEITSSELIAVDDKLIKMRSSKTDTEIRLIRKAAEIADIAMQECLNILTEGTTEAELTGFARYVFEREGGEGASFDPFLMSGKNAWLPQRFSTDKKITPGELAVFDMGAVYRGYCSDLTRTFCIGNPDKEQRKIFDVAYRAQQLAIEAIRPGVTASYIDSIARNYITDAGYGKFFPHITGHGLGISVHEQPILNAGSSLTLQNNMVVTVEPGIYLENVGAVRIEDMVLVTEDGYELLTKTKRNL